MPSVMQEVNKALTPMLRELGFQKKGKHFIRLTEDFAFCVGAECPGSGVYPVFYVIPLFIPTEYPYLTYGNRLNALFPNVKSLVLGKNATEQDINDLAVMVAALVKSDILPFFESVAKPEQMERFLEGEASERTRWLYCPPYEILRLRLYISLKRNQREQVEILLTKYRESILQDAPFTESVKQMRLEEAARVERLLHEDVEKIDQFLSDTRKQVLQNCFKVK